MSLTIKIKIGSNVYNVSNDVVVNTIEIGARADFSFEVGSFKMYTNQITKNIPPYSICQIVDDNGTKYYLISSESTAYFTQNKWVHDCSLLSLEAILECFIVGAKTYSFINTSSDVNVLGYSVSLVNQSVGRDIITITSYEELYDYHNEYTFPDGTSLYTIIKEVCNKNNLKFRVMYSGNFNTDAPVYQISFDTASIQSYDITEDEKISLKFLQDGNNYCKYLQCASADVVDRANPTTFKNLTVRASNGVVVSEDTAEVVLPTRVESITGLKIDATVNFYHLRIRTNYYHTSSSIFSLSYINANNPYHSSLGSYTQSEAHTLHDWCYEVTVSGYANSQAQWQEVANTFDLSQYSNNLFVVKNYDNSQSVYIAMVDDPYGAGIDTEEDLYGADFYKNIDVSKYVIEESYYNSLDASDQPVYLVYKSGDNKITNLNASYKNSFWYILFGQNVNGFFQTSKTYIEQKSSLIFDIKWDYQAGKGTIFNATFDVECVPIANPLLIDSKNTTPINESAWQPLTRTYQMGNSNGLLVDFKALTNDIDKQNDTLGDIEAILELDADVCYFDADESDDVIYYPEPNHQITFIYKNTSFTFYISSMATRYTNNIKTYQLNLSRTPYKIADAIGVDYQFNPTWLPLENIIERGLFFEITYNNFASILNQPTCLIKFYNNGSDAILYFYPVVMKNNGYWILYVEMQDNIVAGMSTTYDDGGKYSIDNIKYCNDNGYFTAMNLYIVAGSGITNSTSLKLPIYTGSDFQHNITVEENRAVYKDSREKLTFTIKVNDNQI